MSIQPTIVNTCFGQLEVFTSGKGPTLVFVHGEEGQRGWLNHHKHLSQSFNLWAPTLPGIGHSQIPDWVQTVPHMSKLLLEALDKANISSCIIGGASLGGWIAAEMVSMDPNRFSGLILCASQGLPTGHLDTPDIFLTPYRRYIGLGYAHTDTDCYRTLWPEEIDDETVEADLETMELVARLAFKPYMYDRGLLSSVKRFNKPTLLVWGEKDIITPISVAEKFKSHLSQSMIKVIKNAGHYIHLEQPKEFTDAVISFNKMYLKGL